VTDVTLGGSVELVVVVVVVVVVSVVVVGDVLDELQSAAAAHSRSMIARNRIGKDGIVTIQYTRRR
jgi:uncharacterized membrane protein